MENPAPDDPPSGVQSSRRVRLPGGGLVRTLDVGVAVLVVAEAQGGPLPELLGGRGLQEVVQELVVDLVEGHPDGEERLPLQVLPAAVGQAAQVQAHAVGLCRGRERDIERDRETDTERERERDRQRERQRQTERQREKKRERNKARE